MLRRSHKGQFALGCSFSLQTICFYYGQAFTGFAYISVAKDCLLLSNMLHKMLTVCSTCQGLKATQWKHFLNKRSGKLEGMLMLPVCWLFRGPGRAVLSLGSPRLFAAVMAGISQGYLQPLLRY